MIRSVASRTSSSGATRTGGPTTTVSATPVRHEGLRPLNITRCIPHSPTGVTGTPLCCASRAVPDFPTIGSRSSEIVPSGKTVTHSPRPSASTAASSDDAASEVPRLTGIWCAPRRIVPSGRFSNSSALARNRTRRWRWSARYASTSGSRYETWLLARITGPRTGIVCAPSIVHRMPNRSGGHSNERAATYIASTVGSIRSLMVADASRLARAGVVIPIRAFAVGKARLSETLDDAPRAELAERMADQVLAAARPLPVVVVSSAEDVRAWGDRHRVDVIDDPGGLDAAAIAGVAWCAGHGMVRAVVA